MPIHHQGTTEKFPAAQGDSLKGPKGSDPALLKQTFKAAFDANSTYRIPTPDEITQMGKDLIQAAYVNDGGHWFGDSVNRDYQNGDNLAFNDVKTGAGGLPGDPQAPNVASPGPGSVNPADLPDPPQVDKPGGPGFPRGDDSLDPLATSKETASQTLGDLILGKSSKNSDVGTK